MTIYTGGILTISDKGSRGEREDTSGPQLKAMLSEQGFSVVAYAASVYCHVLLVSLSKTFT